MRSAIHLSWDNFKETVLVPGEKRVHRITDEPRIDVFGDGTTNRIGVVLEIAPEVAVPASISKLASVGTRTFTVEGRHLLEVSTGKSSLHHEFYHLATAIAERVILHSQRPLDAVTSELDAFAMLLETKSLLGTEREIGLLGELLFLEELVLRNGVGMLYSWIGPSAEPHDFKVGAHEFEVKTTLSSRRIHWINGMEQLLPSAGCQLYLVSVVLGPPGAAAAFSLSSIAAKLTKVFANNREQSLKLEALLASCDFSLADSAHYTRQFALRRPLGIVPIDVSFPAITRRIIQDILGPPATRVDSLSYAVNVEGLEHEHGSDDFEAAMPSGDAA
jgi:hypothetical protein